MSHFLMQKQSTHPKFVDFQQGYCWFRNPAITNIPLFTRFFTSQVVDMFLKTGCFKGLRSNQKSDVSASISAEANLLESSSWSLGDLNGPYVRRSRARHGFFPRHGVWGLGVGGERFTRRNSSDFGIEFGSFERFLMGKHVPESLQIGKIWRKDWHVCWWLNQPIRKISSSNLSNFPRFRGGNKNPIWKYHLVKDDFNGMFFDFDFLQIPPQKKEVDLLRHQVLRHRITNIGVFQESKERKIANLIFSSS